MESEKEPERDWDFAGQVMLREQSRCVAILELCQRWHDADFPGVECGTSDAIKYIKAAHTVESVAAKILAQVYASWQDREARDGDDGR